MIPLFDHEPKILALILSKFSLTQAGCARKFQPTISPTATPNKNIFPPYEISNLVSDFDGFFDDVVEVDDVKGVFVGAVVIG